MTRQLRTDLVVSHSKGEGYEGRRVRKLRDRLEVIDLVATVVRKRHNALFRDHIVELELAYLDVEPARFQEVAESDVGGFKCEDGIVSSSRHEEEADVLGQRSGGQNVHAGKIEPVGREPSFGRAIGRGIEDVRTVRTHTMPLRRHAKRHRPISRLLKDGSVAIIPHLVAVVLERLAKVVQLGPGFVTRRTWHAVLPRESRDGVNLACRNGQRGSGTAVNQ